MRDLNCTRLRLQVEAVENHTPEVIIIDEIGTEAECAAARTIAQRGERASIWWPLGEVRASPLLVFVALHMCRLAIEKDEPKSRRDDARLMLPMQQAFS